MAQLRTFFNIFFDAWKKVGTQENFFELWDFLDNAPVSYSSVNEYWALKDKFHIYFREKGLNDLLSKPIIQFECSAPEYSESSRMNIPRWCGTATTKPTTISEKYLLSLVACFCTIFRDDQAFKDFNVYTKKFPEEELSYIGVGTLLDTVVMQLSETISFSDSMFIQRIKTDKEYMFPFLLVSLFLSRDWQKQSLEDEQENKLKEKGAKWLIEYFYELNQIAANSQLADTQVKYYKMLWEECNQVYLRDMDSSGSSSICKNAQISNLYTIPQFLKNGVAMNSPIDSTSKISQLVIANTGCGKSTYLQAIVTVNIYEAICAVDSEMARTIDVDTYKLLEKQFGFTRKYFPILIKAEKINDYSSDELKEISLLDLLVFQSKDVDTSIFNNLLSTIGEKNGILLLIDALDEISGSNRKEHFGKIVDVFLSEHPSSNIMITSRSVDLSEFSNKVFFRNLDKISLGLFGPDEIYDLISKWMLADGSLSTQEDVTGKFNSIINNNYLFSLSQNPYMLSHILWIKAYNPNASVQEILSELINKIILKRWPKYKYEAIGIDADFMREILSYIAWKMVSTRTHIIAPGTLVSQLKEAADQIDSSLDISQATWVIAAKEMNSRAGLLILEDAGYEFQNETIENYLASEWILSKYYNTLNSTCKSEFDFFQEFSDDFSDIHESYWADVLLMAFSPDQRYKFGKQDKVTPALFRFLLMKSAEAVDGEELTVIANVLIGLLNMSFGSNRITNIESAKGLVSLQQILHFLFNHQHILNKKCSWQDEKYREIYELIFEKKIVEKKETDQ